MKVDYHNFNEYIRTHRSDNKCGHTPGNIDRKDFDTVGNLYDEHIGTINYVSLHSNDPGKEFTGSYPLHDCDVLQCRKCGLVLLGHFNHGGIAPRPVYFMVDPSIEYVSDPATKAVSISYKHFERMLDCPGMREAFAREGANIMQQSDHHLVEQADDLKVCNYREFDTSKGRQVMFDVIGKRETLYAIRKLSNELEALED